MYYRKTVKFITFSWLKANCLFRTVCAHVLLMSMSWQDQMGRFHPIQRILSTRQTESYVYWTVHNFDSWIKTDQLDVTCFIISLFNAQHVSNVSTSILRSLRLICWVISWVALLWFNVCWCYVVVWLGWCGIFMQCFSLHTDTTPPQPNHTVTPTHIEPEQYNPWNNSTNKSQAPEDWCTNIGNMLSIK